MGHITDDIHRAHNRGSLSISVIRRAVADYMASEGCSCCEDVDAHKDHKKRLAKLLDVPKYSDGSGYDFAKFRTGQTLVQSTEVSTRSKKARTNVSPNRAMECSYCYLRFEDKEEEYDDHMEIAHKIPKPSQKRAMRS